MLQKKSASMKNLNLKQSFLPSMKEDPYKQNSKLDSSKGSLPNASKDYSNTSQSSYLLNGMMPRKYSHINKLAQGLVLLDGVKESGTSGLKEPNLILQNRGMPLNGLQPNAIGRNQISVKNQNQKKLATIKFKRRRNSSRILAGSISTKSEAKLSTEVKPKLSQ